MYNNNNININIELVLTMVVYIVATPPEMIIDAHVGNPVTEKLSRSRAITVLINLYRGLQN